MKPKLLYSELTNNYYIATKYKPVGNNDFDVVEKYDVTEEVEAIIKKKCDSLLTECEKLQTYVKHLPSCNLAIDWTTVVNAISLTPKEFRDQSWSEYKDKLYDEMKKCRCGLEELLKAREERLGGK